MWNSFVSIPDHCLFIYFTVTRKTQFGKVVTPDSGYRNVPRFSDRQIWANSADLDQTPNSLHIFCITLRKTHLVQL